MTRAKYRASHALRASDFPTVRASTARRAESPLDVPIAPRASVSTAPRSLKTLCRSWLAALDRGLRELHDAWRHARRSHAREEPPVRPESACEEFPAKRTDVDQQRSPATAVPCSLRAWAKGARNGWPRRSLRRGPQCATVAHCGVVALLQSAPQPA